MTQARNSAATALYTADEILHADSLQRLIQDKYSTLLRQGTRMCPPGSRNYIVKRKPRKLMLLDIPLQEGFEDSSVDSDE